MNFTFSLYTYTIMYENTISKKLIIRCIDTNQDFLYTLVDFLY